MEEIHDIGDTAEVERIVAAAGELPAMPMVAQKVMKLVGDEGTTPLDLQRVISTDPALASKVLRVSNSALFSRVRSISSLSHAIVILGYSTIRSMVITASVRSLFMTAGEYGLKEQMLWEHSLGCGIAARVLAESQGHHGVEAAYMGGLLHDVGKVVLNANRPEAYLEIFQEAYNDGRPLHRVEQDRLGFTHAQVGALVVRRWNFAPELEEALRHHHSPRESQRDPACTAVVHFANLLCHHLGLGCRAEERLDLLDTESAAVLSLSSGDVAALCDRVKELFELEKGIFDT